MSKSLKDRRRNYNYAVLAMASSSLDPLEEFSNWMEGALCANIAEPNAMCLATVDANGQPTTRVVLLKEYSERGFVFYTNYASQKAAQIADNPRVALHFFWEQLERQVNITGCAEKLSRDASGEYFRSRPTANQIATYASKQSQVIANRDVLEERFARFAKQFAGDQIPVPDHWGGYRVIPHQFEFWQGRNNRLHDRIRYTLKNTPRGDWVKERLAP